MKGPKQLSGHFSYGRLWRFTLPTIGMMIFTSLYGMVDGFFVSNFAGKDADFLIFDKNLLTAEPAGLSYTKPSEVYFCGKKM